VALRRQVVDFIRLHFLNHVDQAVGVGHVSVVQAKMQVPVVGVLIEMIDAAGIE
jgi:hypothetical protein